MSPVCGDLQADFGPPPSTDAAHTLPGPLETDPIHSDSPSVNEHTHTSSVLLSPAAPSPTTQIYTQAPPRPPSCYSSTPLPISYIHTSAPSQRLL